MDLNEYIKSGILERYCLGLTSREESRKVEELAEKYPAIRANIQEVCEGVEAYARANAVPPPKRLKAKVIRGVEKEIHQVEKTTEVKRRSIWFPAAASVAFLVLASLAFMFYQKQEKARKELAALSQQVQKLQKDYASLSNSHNDLQAEYVMLKDIRTHHVQMQGSKNAPKAKCVLYWNPDEKGAYLNIVDLPNPPKGHAYQVWADVEGHHHNMGLLNMAAANKDSSFLHPLPYIENSQGFVITLEKQEGSEHPTVEKLFVAGEL